jgi:hypothetical protein
MWSGLQVENRAVVRITNLGMDRSTVKVCVVEGSCRDLRVPRGSRTHILEFDGPAN